MLGIWLGLKLTRTRETVVVREVPVHVEVRVPVLATGAFARDEARVEQLGITPRELEILEAMAAGLSNREIAERLFVSENTVKTHAAGCSTSCRRGVARRRFSARRKRDSSPERMISRVFPSKSFVRVTRNLQRNGQHERHSQAPFTLIGSHP